MRQNLTIPTNDPPSVLFQFSYEVLKEDYLSKMAIATEKENQDNNNTTIADFFKDKNIFITGGTGFLGTVLIEGLLSVTPDIGTIYVLVRAKHGFDAEERISRMLQKAIFEKHNEKTLKKVVPVLGSLSDPKLGFPDEIYRELTEKVNIIYHAAATIRFSSPLRTSILTNLTGTLRTIEFAKSLKNLSAYIHLSTAFCNSNNRGLITETVYKSHWEPKEMIRMAEDDKAWEDFTPEKLKEIIRDHPNTYTFTKNLAENLIQEEMSGLPAAIVRPSIVYGTWEHPIEGWVGNATSGHLGFLAGYIKGVFRTMNGNASSAIDVIPCDYVINSSLVMGWYVGTRKLATPEVIHCTSGEVNPLTLEQFTDTLNKCVKYSPADYYLWKPYTKIRNGWRYALFFFLFQIIPSIFILLPEKIFNLGMTHHTTLEYMRVFHNGTKAFDYFLDKDFRYSLTNALRIISFLNESDRARYTFDASNCDWSKFMSSCLVGVRRFYFKESAKTTQWHRIHWKITEVLYYLGFIVLFGIVYSIVRPVFGGYGLGISLLVWAFLVWL
ncbi:unnamed protein product [Hermetia illucens]|uniref:Fatty acyl-CoA reductase n=1 Tax=Hermetia illucens TaxID=343691 RepID=A0A7R8UW75_HERIL|nr:unnamed protein product [Hermetia illucens]